MSRMDAVPRGRLHAVFFDLDGTLVDSLPDLAASVNELMSVYGLPPHALPTVRGMIGNGIEKLVERGFAAHGITLDSAELAERYERMMGIYGRHLTGLTTLTPGAGEAVRAARRIGARTGVVTNKPEGFSRTILTHFGLTPDIDIVIGGDSGYPKKPGPEMLLAACALSGCKPADAVMVGDSTADVAAARAAGVPSIILRGGYTNLSAEELGGDFIIDGFDALAGLLSSLQGAAK